MTGALYIRPLSSHEDLRACVALQRETWGQDFSELVPAAILLVSQRIGGVTAGAFDDDGTLQGFVFGMTGWEAGRPVHWSDMLAVRRAARGRGVGTLLKRHQRDRLLAIGVASVYWTFDPLESRNAHINFARLGIIAREYETNLYGDTDSPLHAGIGTDRLVALWPIASERVRRRLEGGAAPAPVAFADAPATIPVVMDGGLPRPGEPRLELEQGRIRVAVPADIQALKRDDLPLARAWRERTRTTFLHYLGRGWEVRELVREGAWSSYVLERTGADDSLDR